MRLLKAVFAGFFVLVVGFFTAAVIAISAVVIFIGRRLRGNFSSPSQAAPRSEVRRPRASSMADGDDVIDVDATEIPPAR